MKILIATDGSEQSKRAVEISCRMFAENDNSEFKVLSVYKANYPLALAPFEIPQGYQKTLERQAQTEAQKNTEEAAEIIRRVCPKVDLTTDVEELSVGSVGQMIIEKTKEWHSDLIVVGSHGKGFFGRLTNGSTSDELVHHAPCPVLVVP